MKKILSILVSVMLLGSVLGACTNNNGTDPNKTTTATEKTDGTPNSPSSTKKFKVGATMKDLSDQFVKNIGDAMKASADQHSDVIEFEMLDAQGDVSKQIEQVESFVTKKYDAIIMVAQDAEGSSAAVEIAKNAGIPLIECNTLTTSEDYTVYVGSDDVNAGKMQAEFLMDKLPENAQVVYLMGPMGQSGQIKRLEGIQQALFDVRKDIVVLDKQSAEWKRDKAMQFTEDWLTKYGDKINAVICQNDDMAMGALAAIEAKGLGDKVMVIGVDAITDALQAVKDGRLSATVFQNSKGQSAGAVEAAIKILQGEKVEHVIDIPFELVTKENVDEYIGKN